MIVISKLPYPEASGDWHDKPLRWIVSGPDAEVQKFSTRADARLYARIRAGVARNEAVHQFVLVGGPQLRGSDY